MDRMKATISDDRISVAVEFLPASGASGQLALDLDQLTNLIGALAKIREQMAAGQDAPPLQDVEISIVANTAWRVEPEPMTGGTLFAFHHPSFGPVGIALSKEDAVAASVYLVRVAGVERPAGNA